MYNLAMKLNAQQLRELEEEKIRGELRKVKRNPIYFILENIYDTYNIGGLFRLADALAVEKMYICGQTEIPPNSRIKKASIGTYKVVPWEYKNTVKDAILSLRSAGRLRSNPNKIVSSPPALHNDMRIIAVEQHRKAIPYKEAEYHLPLALIFGNETSGILPETLELVDQIVEIPMFGINKSLNVIVSAAIVSYRAIELLNTQY